MSQIFNNRELARVLQNFNMGKIFTTSEAQVPKNTFILFNYE